MIKEIRQAEKASRSLEPSESERKKIRSQVVAYTENFLSKIYKAKAFIKSGTINSEIHDSKFSEEKEEVETVLETLENCVDTPGMNTASGEHLGYIPGGGIYYSALGDYIAGITNRYAGVYFASPGAVQIENKLCSWMAELVGYPETAAGNLSSGGSIANLIALVTARDAFGIKGKDLNKVVVYLTDQTHHCIIKALRIAGLEECRKNYVPTDDDYRMLPFALEQKIINDKKEGLIPWMVIATAGTTNTGAIDPLDELGDSAAKHGLWYHVDGAYGAFFILTESGKKALKGIEKSDSVVMDPHKGLFLPYGLGAVLIKDKRKMIDAHYYRADYMQDTILDGEEISPADLSPEMSKHFRGLRMWLPLKLHGIAPFRSALEEKLLLAQYFYEKIKAEKGFEVGPTPELSVVTFRYVPSFGDADEFNEKLINEIQRDGRIFISSTTLNGQFVLRVAILSFRTHLETIDRTILIIKEKADYLLSFSSKTSVENTPVLSE